ncbi:MAG TPA: HAD-IIB family hydrolase [Bacteroidetes bacterium]|nr:HAD-IIB family hydrolase [Bacteroidota bacterium]
MMEKKTRPGMVLTDFDGTLHHPVNSVSSRDLETLHRMEDEGIVRVIATGRNLFSFRRLIPDDFPVDYLIFSTGCGIYDWKNKKMVHACSLDRPLADAVVEKLVEEGVGFMVHREVPENHHFVYFPGKELNPDFEKRCELYRPYASPFDGKNIPFQTVSQVLAIVPPDGKKFDELAAKFEGVRVIRSTSPISGEWFWMEFFHPGVSKGAAAAWLSDHLGIDRERTLALGNDYNDVEMLEWAGHAYMVEDAPEDLKALYRQARRVEDHALTGVMDLYW